MITSFVPSIDRLVADMLINLFEPAVQIKRGSECVTGKSSERESETVERHEHSLIIGTDNIN